MTFKAASTLTPDGSPDIRTCLDQLQTLTAAFGTGAAINTNIAITGIKTTATIIGAVEIQPPTAGSGNTMKTNLKAEISVTSAGNVQCTTTNTTGNQVLVIYCNHD